MGEGYTRGVRGFERGWEWELADSPEGANINKICTHRDPEYIGVISLVVVPIKCSFSDCECSFDCKRIHTIGGSGSEMLINVVHSQYYCCDARGLS